MLIAHGSAAKAIFLANDRLASCSEDKTIKIIFTLNKVLKVL